MQHAVASLLNRKTHQHFIGYLYIRKLAAESGAKAPASPNWASLGDYLYVEGGPENKPYLRPFWPGARHAKQEWLNKNIAGSFSPSSVRSSSTNPFSTVVTIDSEGVYTLREDHVNAALASLLFGNPMNVVSLALFLYRNVGIWSIDAPTIEGLIACFRDDFGYTSRDHEEEFRTLYDVDSSMTQDIFEPIAVPIGRFDDDERIPGSLTAHPVRSLTATDLGLPVNRSNDHLANRPPDEEATMRGDQTPIPKNDDYYIRVLSLMTDYGGIIFAGPSGTGKSYYARRIALALTDGVPERCRFVQFHPSYQYEDFVEGFRPSSDGSGFTLRESHFLQLCRTAIANPGKKHVLVIDELSRGDPGRVFGEALTYLELSKRNMLFHLASGKELHIPNNLWILATMNPLDYGADQIDAAFDRRFAKIQMYPDISVLRNFLESAGMDEALRQRVCRFFEETNNLRASNPYASIGHTYFLGISDIPSLQRLWDNQLEHNLSKAFPFDKEQVAKIRTGWNAVVDPQQELSSGESHSENPDSPRI